jgi:Co/Zn/Cd efflux system component
VLASLIDSTVDLLAQAILLVTNRLASASRDDRVAYPAGRSRAEPVGVIACALLMAMASAQVIRDAACVLIDFATMGEERPITMSISDEGLLAGTIASKFLLYLWCRQRATETANVTVDALAQDHYNDVLSNAAALVAAVLTQLHPALWLADPIGAIVISLYIIYSWACTGMEQLDLVVGKSADADFLDLVCVCRASSLCPTSPPPPQPVPRHSSLRTAALACLSVLNDPQRVCGGSNSVGAEQRSLLSHCVSGARWRRHTTRLVRSTSCARITLARASLWSWKS